MSWPAELQSQLSYRNRKCNEKQQDKLFQAP
jgi:hypothetical protein